MSGKKKILVIGGGLSGLACAVRLREGGAEPLLLEGSDSIGGRVRTDYVDGFQLDRGFQVYLTAYPEAAKILDLESLDLRPFRAGALVFQDETLHRVMDVFRHPAYFLSSALAPVGTWMDKFRVGRMRFRRAAIDAGSMDGTTEAFLRKSGFSERMIDGFFRAFYGGIFLEQDLRTSSRMFEFTFRMFSEGFAALPAGGMQAIPDQLAARLSPSSIRLNAVVHTVEEQAVVLEGGQRLEGDAVVIATDATAAARMLPGAFSQPPSWRSVTGIYFSADQSPLQEAIIALNGSGRGLVNNVCVLSDVARDYAPEGKSLISVSIRGIPEKQDLESSVQNELCHWFGGQVEAWRHLKTYSISQALPEQRVTPLRDGVQCEAGIWLCGDHCTSASIEGALVSGKTTADAVLAKLHLLR